MSEDWREKVVAAGRSWRGTPFHHGIGVKGVGVDCLYLLYRVYVDECGLVEPFEIPLYRPQWFMHKDQPLYLEGIAKRARRIEDWKRALPGDFLMFNMGRHAAHSAIVTIQGRSMVHAYEPARSVLEDDPRRFIGETPRERMRGSLHSAWTIAPA